MNWDATYVCGGHVPKEHSVSVHYRPASEINVLARFAGVHYNHCESVRSLVVSENAYTFEQHGIF